ncbi:MAG: Abi family protein [Bacillota bacterium]
MEYKSINSLMKHLRDRHGIDIWSKNKSWLTNNGYYHSFKGYRFYNNSKNHLKITDINQLIAITDFDNSLKDLLYSKVMFIETAIKNVALCEILDYTNDSSLKKVEHIALNNYFYARRNGLNDKASLAIQQKKVNLQQRIYAVIKEKYSARNKIICNFVNKQNEDIPIWAIFEVLTLGEFGNFILALKPVLKLDISEKLHINKVNNSNGELLHRYIFFLKDLRNAVAHNGVVYDGRFRSASIDKSVKKSVEQDTNISMIDFEYSIDYIIFIVMMLRKLGVSKTEVATFINKYEAIAVRLYNILPFSEYTRCIGTQSKKKIQELRLFVKNS